jgi:hypothetical protein
MSVKLGTSCEWEPVQGGRKVKGESEGVCNYDQST